MCWQTDFYQCQEPPANRLGSWTLRKHIQDFLITLRIPPYFAQVQDRWNSDVTKRQKYHIAIELHMQKMMRQLLPDRLSSRLSMPLGHQGECIDYFLHSMAKIEQLVNRYSHAEQKYNQATPWKIIHILAYPLG